MSVCHFPLRGTYTFTLWVFFPPFFFVWPIGSGKAFYEEIYSTFEVMLPAGVCTAIIYMFTFNEFGG